MLNALTIDVEDYFMVSVLAKIVSLDDWGKYESRVEKNTIRLLDLLDNNSIKATFFILGWVAENYQAIVREIQKRGHEIGCHGYNHRLIYNLTRNEFREDTKKAKGLIGDITGEPVEGYRAASFSITKRSLWALDILIDEGFKYDSSIFPVHHDLYGYPEFSRFPLTINRQGGSIVEIPMSTLRFLGKNFPVAGGGYLRLLPAWFTKWGIRSINKKAEQSAVIYLHPWELDEHQPKLDGGSLSNFRHHVNIKKMESRIKELVDNFELHPIRDVFSKILK